VPVLEKKKAERYSLSLRRKASAETWRQHRLRNETGDLRIWASLERQSTHVGRAIATSCYQPFGITVYIHFIFWTMTNLVAGIMIALLFFDHMAFLLDLW
jgi:hypothetical protein